MSKTTRKDEVLALMRRKTGVTVEQICAKTGMLPHSARAFISRLEAPIVKTKKDGKPTVYSIEQQEAA